MQVNRAIPYSDGLELQVDVGRMRVDLINERIFHVRYTRAPEFSPAPSLLVLPQPASKAHPGVQEAEASIALSSACLRLEIAKKSGAFTWKDAAGELLVREPEYGGKALQAIDLAGQAAWSTRLELVFSPGEALYGLGQHEQGIFNYRGHSEYLYQHNRKVAMPVLVSTRGYAIFFDSTSLGSFHDDQYGSHFFNEVEDELDFYFLYGPEFDTLVAGMRQLTGAPSLLPRWAYGFIQSKERYKRQNELIEIVHEYRRRGIGLDCIVLDWMSWPGNQWGQKSLDPDRFPDPARLVKELNTQHVKWMVSIWPRLQNDGPDQQELRQQGALLGDDSTYNAFDPQARALFWQQANRGLFQHGVDAWWCDSSEPFEPDWQGDFQPEPWQRVLLNTSISKKYLNPAQINAYSLLHAQGIYEGQRSVTKEKRVVNLTRSAAPGQARYGTVTWSGDVSARWETLRKQIPAGLNFTVTGSPRWTFDVGGFFVDNRRDSQSGPWFWDGDFPAGCADPGYRELFVRWFQVGTFLSMLRSHGTDTPREIWRFGRPGETAYDTLVRFVRLRYRLLPYLYSLAAWETFHGYTMLRALAFDFRHDPLVYDIADQFMCGPALMVCPVTTPMYFGPNALPLEKIPRERSVYLPEGNDWYNFWTGKRYAGGQLLRVPAPLELLPLYVRAGSLLPLGQAVNYADEYLNASLELRVYPGRDGRFDLYTDEGDSYRYEQGEYAWTRLAWDNAARTLQIGPRSGSYRDMPPSQSFKIVIGGAGSEPNPPVETLKITGSEKAYWKQRIIKRVQSPIFIR